MQTIVINATAARFSGALTILKDCVSYVESNCACSYDIHLFTTVDIFDECKWITVHKFAKQSWVKRIRWDEGGLRKYCDKNKIKPVLVLSLQNTSTKYYNAFEKLKNINKTLPFVNQLVYYHQSLPLVRYNWNLFNKQELVMFCYAHFYAFFVRRNSRNCRYIVQLPYIKALFLRKFRKVVESQVSVIRPNNPEIDKKSIPEIGPFQRFSFLYPATPLKYKNHRIIVESLVYLKKKNPSVLSNIEFFFTVSSLPSQTMELISENELTDVIKFIGSVSYNELLSYYKSVDALIFPSLIETFGLPLLEAASFGLPIIASDLPYAQEALHGYSNAIFCTTDDISDWGSKIEKYDNLHRAESIGDNKTNSWESVFALIESIITGDRARKIGEQTNVDI